MVLKDADPNLPKKSHEAMKGSEVLG